MDLRGRLDSAIGFIMNPSYTTWLFRVCVALAVAGAIFWTIASVKSCQTARLAEEYKKSSEEYKEKYDAVQQKLDQSEGRFQSLEVEQDHIKVEQAQLDQQINATRVQIDQQSSRVRSSGRRVAAVRAGDFQHNGSDEERIKQLRDLYPVPSN